MNWKWYYPEDGETVEDAVEWTGKDTYAGELAIHAAKWDYHNRDGWEREPESEFKIIIVDPQGIEHKFVAYHYETINHSVDSVE